MGTKEYFPPEVRFSGRAVNPREYTYDPTKLDIFNLGVILFIMAFGKMPFIDGATNIDKHYKHLLNNDTASFL